ncbi:MAG: DUF502 domain-containing protein [Bacillota bacterium]
MKRNLRNYFLTGLAVILPGAATIWILWKLLAFVDGFAGRLVAYITPYKIPGLGVLVTLLLIVLVGIFATNVIGRSLLALWERIVFRIPLVNTIYRAAKEIVETFGENTKQVFRQVVLVRFPRRDTWAVGFVVGEAGEGLNNKAGQELVKVLVPHVPLPMSGFLLFVPREELIYLDIPVEDGLRLIVSTGILEPNSLRTAWNERER